MEEGEQETRIELFLLLVFFFFFPPPLLSYLDSFGDLESHAVCVHARARNSSDEREELDFAALFHLDKQKGGKQKGKRNEKEQGKNQKKKRSSKLFPISPAFPLVSSSPFQCFVFSKGRRKAQAAAAAAPSP